VSVAFGAGPEIYDAFTGEVVKAHFVMILLASKTVQIFQNNALVVIDSRQSRLGSKSSFQARLSPKT